MRNLTIVLSLLLAVGSVGSSWAALAEEDEHAATAEKDERAPLLEDFFLTESVYPQDQGETQLTLTSEYDSAEEGEAFTLSAGIEFGLTDQLQIEAEWDAFSSIDPDGAEDSNGSGDAAVGLKYTFEPCPTTGIQLAAGLDVTLPTGNDDVSENAYIYEPYLVMSKDLGDAANLHVSVAYGIVDAEEDGEEILIELPEEGLAEAGEEASDEITVSLGSVYRVAPDWRLTLEANLESDEIDSGSETAAYLAPGFLWKGIDDVEAGLAVAAGLTDDSDDWRLLAMISYEF